MNGKYNDFRDLEVWKLCKEIRETIWKLTRSFPKEEQYRLADQMIRASRSASNCIAEGYGRFHYQENIQFCRQARGSLFELSDHLMIALECSFIDENIHNDLFSKVKDAIRTLNGYIKYLTNEKNNS